MKTQISRDSFQPGQRYSGLYLQQGRMITDADWNELTDIGKARLIDALRDVVSGANAPAGPIAGGAPRVGGLRLFADPAGSDKVFIQPGELYAEGVPARLAAAKPMRINEQPDYPIAADYPGQSLLLYADVWERAVTALERADLMDAALHGADTATRTQTMVQIKWCDSVGKTIDPLDPDDNPPQGNGLLSLQLTLIASGGDACDPCAGQVEVDERIGNYLFRVEVHDYEPATGWLTLKWSRDNGAEACPVKDMPNGFDQGPWVWEFFDGKTERLLGNHLAANVKNARGLIKETCVAPTLATEPKDFVRQWDGYLRINLNTLGDATVQLSGRDRGVALAQGAAATAAHGRVNATGGLVRVNLERMELRLDTAGKRFVAGDYWLAAVRESAHASGQYVLPAMADMTAPGQGEPPRGVRHHYLLLGEIGINRKLVEPSDAFRRRMAFPPLTDLAAADVGFVNTCPGLFSTAENVQQALDKLCAIGAEDIAYLPPSCGGNEGKSIKDRLKAAWDANSDAKLTVKEVLDSLLCQLNAASLPYAVPTCSGSPTVRELLGIAAGDANVAPVLDKLLCEFKAGDLPLDKSDPELCSDLQPASVATVQDALKTLCAKSSGGCAQMVTSAGHLEALLEEFAKGKTLDLWICLKAGTYPIGKGIAIGGKRSLRVSGQGPESATIVFAGDALRIEADEVIFENLAFTCTSGGGQLAIRAATSRTSGCSFSRTTTSAGGPAMISLGGQGGAVCRFAWQGNVLYAQRKSVKTGAAWGDVDLVGDDAVKAGLHDLTQASLLDNKVAFDESLLKVAKQIIVLPKDIRTGWKNALETAATPRAAATTRPSKASAATMTGILTADVVTVAEAAEAVKDLIDTLIDYTPDYALRLESVKVGGVLSGNEIEGWLLLANGVAGYRNPEDGVISFSLEGDAVKSGGEDLRIDNNRITAIKANLPAGTVEKRTLKQRVAGYARLMLTNNSFSGYGNTVTAAVFVGQGNTWLRTGSDDDWMGSVVADRATFCGNLLDAYASNDVLSSTVRKDRLASVGNVLIELLPLP